MNAMIRCVPLVASVPSQPSADVRQVMHLIEDCLDELGAAIPPRFLRYFVEALFRVALARAMALSQRDRPGRSSSGLPTRARD